VSLTVTGRQVPASPRAEHGDDRIVLWQIVVGVVWLAIWEATGWLTDSQWISRPSLIVARLWQWLQGDLLLQLATTVTEVFVGLFFGAVFGVAFGLWLGRSPTLATILRPIIVALYSVPLIALAPLFIMFFGLDMQPKIILVAIATFFLLFFNAFAGAQQVDEDLIAAIDLMGCNARERFLKVIAPACMTWIIGGIRIALPYALVGAVTAEMLAARRGMGFLLANAASEFDMTSLYTALFVLMLLGLAVSEAAAWIEHRLLRWRHAAE
jgi:NitT/TauT family transport system permease protein